MKTLLLTLLFTANTLIGGGVAVLNGLAHEFNVTPGSTYHGRIELQNASDNAQVVILYQTDMTTKFTGETFYTDSLENSQSNKNWIKLSNLNVTIDSEEKRSIEFEIIVPESNSLVGTYWSVIMVEPRDPIHIQQDESGFNIQSKVRYAIQIICHIGETGTTDLKFVNISQKKYNNTRYLEVDIKNTGQILIKPTLSLELFNAEGNSLPIIKSEKQRIFPQSSKRYILDISVVEPGIYQGILIADNTTDDLFGVNITLHLKDDG